MMRTRCGQTLPSVAGGPQILNNTQKMTGCEADSGKNVQKEELDRGHTSIKQHVLLSLHLYIRLYRAFQIVGK